MSGSLPVKKENRRFVKIDRVLSKNIDFVDVGNDFHIMFTEEGELYINNSAKEIINVSNMVFVETVDELLAIPNPYSHKIYVVRKEYGLYIYNESDLSYYKISSDVSSEELTDLTNRVESLESITHVSIDDTNASTSTTFSSQKMKEIFSEKNHSHEHVSDINDTVEASATTTYSSDKLKKTFSPIVHTHESNISDIAIASDKTYSSSKIDRDFSKANHTHEHESEINDASVSTDSTYSSSKISAINTAMGGQIIAIGDATEALTTSVAAVSTVVDAIEENSIFIEDYYS